MFECLSCSLPNQCQCQSAKLIYLYYCMWILLLLVLSTCQSPTFLQTLSPLLKSPLQLKAVVLGQTTQSNPLTVYILSKEVFTNLSDLNGRQAVLLDSYMHAREPYSLQLMQALAASIVSRGSEGQVGEFLNKGVFIFYPFVNPDGYSLYQENTAVEVRKNRNAGGVKCGSGLAGVDINRNFPANFGIIPQSSRPCSEQYHGKGPFSQAQAQVFQQLFKIFRILIAIDFHSYGNEWIYPYAWDKTGLRVKEHLLFPFYHSIKNQFTARGRKIRSCIESLGYIADGVYIDWALDQGALSFAFEVGTTFRSDKQEDISRDVEAAIEDFYLIFRRTLPRYQTRTRANSLFVKSKSLARVKISVEVGERVEEREMGAGEEVSVQLTANDTYATITNHETGEKEVVSLRLRDGFSLTPFTIICIIVLLLCGILASFYSRWQGLHRKYGHVVEGNSLTIQEMPSIGE